MRVLFVASEVHPLIKTGGLADVIGALPPALAELGVEVRCLIPGYPAVMRGLEAARPAGQSFPIFAGGARLVAGRCGPLEVVAFDAPHLFDRPGNPYLGPDRRDWPDNHRRFAALAQAAVRIAAGALPGWRPDVVHGHDWQAGLVPAYLAHRDGETVPTVMTIHNLAYQGVFTPEVLDEIGLPPETFRVDGVEFRGGVGFLKAGLFHADRLTTVSPTYAREIQTEAQGLGLHGLLAARRAVLTGILNGIDPAVWDPRTDPHLPARYGSDDLAGKAACKRTLQERLGLELRPDAPVLGVVSRLTPAKGLDLLHAALPVLLEAGGQLALLGQGDDGLESMLQGAAAALPGRVGVVIGYDEPLAHLIQGGADMIAVPSRTEACGLTEMYGLRYGTLPLVARVGGLADTVIDANQAALDDGVATGFVFAPVTREALEQTLRRALDLYARPEAWARVRERAMGRDFSWRRSAKRYRALYAELTA